MKNNIDERFDLINQLYEIDSIDITGRPTELLAHAILNTINIHELVKISVNKESANDIIASNILKRLPNDDHNNIEIYEYIFDSLKSATYNNRLRFRKILECIVITFK